MLQSFVTILIGLFGGICVGVQTPVVNAVGQRTGGASSSFIVHLSGAILSGILLVFRGGENIKDIGTLPWWMLGCGIFGVILFQTINFTIPRIGATAAIMLVIVGQLLTGMVFDHFGLLGVAQRSLDVNRIVAVLLLLAGAFLMSK